MQNALFVGVSAQAALTRELDVIANNMANVSTTGFKARNARFQEFLMPVASADSFSGVDRRISYVIDNGTPLDLTQGSIEPDGNPMHVAVRGEAFLSVQTPNGIRYTRNGAFELNAAGTLVNSDGYAVQGDSGPIAIGQQETGLSVAPDGTVSTNLGTRGKIKLVTFAKPQGLKSEGANLFSSDEQPKAAGIEGRLESGALERSNVKPVIEMTRLMDVNRSYAMVSSVISRLDDLRGTAIRRLADVA